MYNKLCAHVEWLINQGKHWCELQLPHYPNCEGCPLYQEPPEVEIYSNSTGVGPLDRRDQGIIKPVKSEPGTEKWISKGGI